jgi:hypothetical protein
VSIGSASEPKISIEGLSDAVGNGLGDNFQLCKCYIRHAVHNRLVDAGLVVGFPSSKNGDGIGVAWLIDLRVMGGAKKKQIGVSVPLRRRHGGIIARRSELFARDMCNFSDNRDTVNVVAIDHEPLIASWRGAQVPALEGDNFCDRGSNC